MDQIRELLTNAGFIVNRIDDQYIYFQDPSCIFTAFDTILDYAWILIFVLTAIMLFGWGVLYIKNGVKLESLSNNVKSLLLIFGVLSVIKPAINVIYGNDLFGRLCDEKRVSRVEIQKLLDMRNKELNTNANVNFSSSWDPSIDTGEQIGINISGSSVNNHQIQQINDTTPSNITVFINRDGVPMQHANGSRSWRNNSPGNIRGSAGLLYGATSIKDGFLVFPDAETGLQAISKLFRGKNYSSLSLNSAMHRYAPAADHNVPDAYARHISKATGISVNTKMQDINDQDLRRIALAIRQFEGWRPGVETRL